MPLCRPPIGHNRLETGVVARILCVMDWVRMRHSFPPCPRRARARVALWLTLAGVCPAPLICLVLLNGCAWPMGDDPAKPPGPADVQMLRFDRPLEPRGIDPPFQLRGARNQTIHVAFQINRLPALGRRSFSGLRIGPLRLAGGEDELPLAGVSAYQVLSMPVDTKRASFIRQMAVGSPPGRMPRALLPLPIHDGRISLRDLRHPDRPTGQGGGIDPDSDAVTPILWLDIRVPPTAPAGRYESVVELVQSGRTLFSAPLMVEVDEVVIPDDRHLVMVGAVAWDDLRRLFPSQFDTMNPALISRTEPSCAGAVEILDQIVKLAHEHRVVATIPRLAPVVKWFSNRPPLIDWVDYEGLVRPWLAGDGLADRVPLGFWPLPVTERLEERDVQSQLSYWLEVAAYFDQRDWLGRSAVVVAPGSSGRASLLESFDLSQRTAALLRLHPRLRVLVPLEEEQVMLASEVAPTRIAPQDADRVIHLAAGLVAAPPSQRLPEHAQSRWLRIDRDGFVPCVGVGVDEREVRALAWLAFVRDAQIFQLPPALPSGSGPEAPALPEQMPWFYPGSWFGVEGLVPTLQLKWLRRAEEEYELLWLARQRGQANRAGELARLLVRPVHLRAAQAPDPVYALLCGTSDAGAWDEAEELLRRTLQLAQPGVPLDPVADRDLSYRMSSWSASQQRPLLLTRSAEWAWGNREPQGRRWIALRMGIDIYSAADQQFGRGRLLLNSPPEGWSAELDTEGVSVLAAGQVARFPLTARISPDGITAASRRPVRIIFEDGFTSRRFSSEVMLPVAVVDKRQGPPPAVDGTLAADWVAADAIHEGHLLRMLDRPSLQNQQLQRASTPSAVYATWTDTMLYLAFRVSGADAPLYNVQRSSFDYDQRRAWGEDICEFLVQAVFADNSLGPLVYLVCKSGGQMQSQQRLDPKYSADGWRALPLPPGLPAYASAVFQQQGIWQGEIALPWEALARPGEPAGRPTLLRFNFAQHRGTTGESATWAGPVDHGRDEGLMGLLELRGMVQPPETVRR